jgi:cytidine deaminase
MTEVERDIDLESLFDSAIRVRTLPYSQFRVGVSLLAVSGNIYVGCMQPHDLCRTRLHFGGDSGGRTKFSGDRSGSRYPISGSPCGAFGQVLAEFNPDLVIYFGTLKDPPAATSLSRIL